MTSAHFAAIAAFSLWGLFPIYWKFLSEVPAWDLFAHRLLFSFITLNLILFFRKEIYKVVEIWKDPRKRILLSISGGLIASNWLLYIYAINNGRILESSMGYFMNPLFNILLGRLILKERLRPTQWPAIALAVFAMVLIGIQADINHIPWIAILLSVSFGLYGLIRKLVHVGSMEGLAFETSVVFIPVILYWFYHGTTPATAFHILPAYKIPLLILAGGVTSIPLILFAYGAKRLSFSALGMTQYLSPSLKFVCGLVVFGEPLSKERLTAFVIIWVALAWYTAESVLHSRFKSRVVPE